VEAKVQKAYRWSEGLPGAPVRRFVRCLVLSFDYMRVCKVEMGGYRL